MKKITWLFVALALFALSACTGAEKVLVETATPLAAQATPELAPTETAAAPAEEIIPTVDEAIPAEAESTQVESEPPAGEQIVSECTLVSSLPDPPQEYAELFSIQEDDWVIGTEEPAITLIEYGDFQ